MNKEDQINSVQDKLDKILLSNKAKLEVNTSLVDGGKHYLAASKVKFEVQLLKALRSPASEKHITDVCNKNEQLLSIKVSGWQKGLLKGQSGSLKKLPSHTGEKEEDAKPNFSQIGSARTSKPGSCTLLTEVSMSSKPFRLRSLSPREHNPKKDLAPVSEAISSTRMQTKSSIQEVPNKLVLFSSPKISSHAVSEMQSFSVLKRNHASESLNVSSIICKPQEAVLRPEKKLHLKDRVDLNLVQKSKTTKMLQRISQGGVQGLPILKYYNNPSESARVAPKPNYNSENSGKLGANHKLLHTTQKQPVGGLLLQPWDSGNCSDLQLSLATTPVKSRSEEEHLVSCG